MSRKVHSSISAALVCVVVGYLTSCGNSSSKTVSAVATTMATSGTVQSVTVGMAFAAPLAVKVMSNGSPAGGVSVTFTAPSSGPSGTFTNGMVTETDTTDSNGVATSSVFTANRTAGTYAVTAAAAG